MFKFNEGMIFQGSLQQLKSRLLARLSVPDFVSQEGKLGRILHLIWSHHNVDITGRFGSWLCVSFYDTT